MDEKEIMEMLVGKTITAVERGEDHRGFDSESVKITFADGIMIEFSSWDKYSEGSGIVIGDPEIAGKEVLR